MESEKEIILTNLKVRLHDLKTRYKRDKSIRSEEGIKESLREIKVMEEFTKQFEDYKGYIMEQFEQEFLTFLIGEVLKIKNGDKTMLAIDKEDGYVQGFKISNKELLKLYNDLVFSKLWT